MTSVISNQTLTCVSENNGFIRMYDLCGWQGVKLKQVSIHPVQLPLLLYMPATSSALLLGDDDDDDDSPFVVCPSGGWVRGGVFGGGEGRGGEHWSY